MLRRAWIRNSLIGLVGFLVLFGALGYWVAPGLIQRAAQEKLSTLLGRATTIGAVSVRPFSLAVKIADFRIAKASGAGALLEIAEIDAGLSLATLYRFAPVINRLHVTAPHIAIERLGPQRFDFSDILDRLSINNIEISDGLVTFDDDVTHSRHRLDGITLNLPFISTIRHDVELYVEPAFSAKLDGSPLALKGKSRPFEESLETALNLQVEALDLPNYVSFAPLTLRPKLASGLLSTNLQIAFRRDPNGSPHIVLSGQATLDKLRVLKPDEVEALSAKRIALDLKSLDLLAAAVEVNSLEIKPRRRWPHRSRRCLERAGRHVRRACACCHAGGSEWCAEWRPGHRTSPRRPAPVAWTLEVDRRHPALPGPQYRQAGGARSDRHPCPGRRSVE